MTVRAKPEHSSAQGDRINERGKLYILNYPRTVNRDQCITSRDYVIRMFPSPDLLCPAKALTWRGGMNHPVLVTMFFQVLDSVTLNERKGISRLWRDIYPGHVKAGQVVSHPGPADTAEQVKKFESGS